MTVKTFVKGDRVRLRTAMYGVDAGTEGVVTDMVDAEHLFVQVEGYVCPVYGDDIMALFDTEVEHA